MLTKGISRRELQAAAVAALAGRTVAQDRVFSPRPWPTRPEEFPIIIVQAPGEKKIGVRPGVLRYNTTITLVAVARVVDFTPESLDAALEAFAEQIETALISDPEFMLPVQSVVSIETTKLVNADGKLPFGEIGMQFEIEVFQAYSPDATPLIDVQGTIQSQTTGATLAVVDVPLS